MKRTALVAAVAALASAGCFASLAHAAPVPCEDKLAELRGAMGGAKLADADMQAVKQLEAKGVERCNADDDKRADGFFSDALALIRK